ncbi:MAG: DUF134 domain-containing protein [Bacillota bacterium]|nr:DUF134 domain-containing protein [Bacillota bacterium]
MPRQTRCRKVCCDYGNRQFRTENCRDIQRITVEEVESLRLCDMEGLPQDIAAEMMEVSRGTFQRILYSARKKVATALVEGDDLSIGGGHYEVTGTRCEGRRCCKKCRK